MIKIEPFESIISDITAKYKKIKNENYISSGKYAIVDQGKDFIGGYTDDENLIISSSQPVIVFGDHTRMLKFVDFPFAIGADGVKVLSVDRDRALSKYIFYFLKASNIPNVGYSRHYKYLKEIKIALPEKKEDQFRIVTILEKAEKLITQRQKSIDALDEFLQSTFLEMFGHITRNTNNFGSEPLIKFGNIITGNTPPRGDPKNYSPNGIEWIKTDNIDANKIIITKSVEYLSEAGEKKSRIVNKGALLVACIAGSIESIGRAALTDRKVAFNQQINAIQPFDDVEPFYLYWLFKTSKEYIQKCASKGMKKILTKGDFENILMLKAPHQLQKHFSQIAERSDVLKSQYLESLHELENLYDSLSQKAFKGELDLNKVVLPDEFLTLAEIPHNNNVAPQRNDESTDDFGPIEEEVIINSINEELKVFHESRFHTGAPNDIDNTIRQLEAELKIKGDIPFYEEYVRYKIIKEKFRESFSFDQLWQEIINFPFESVPDYDRIADMLYKWLDGDNPFIKQRFNETTRQIELVVI
jgi:type I restriction enzyme S subunit